MSDETSDERPDDGEAGPLEGVGTLPTIVESAGALAAASTAGVPAWAGAAPLRRGETVGRYLVVEHLGSGGMGIVYTAYDPELDRKVALKLLKSGGEDEAGRARLVREAQAMAKLAHPNVVAVHDVGTVDGEVFVAMEFIEGMTLSRWRWSAPRTPEAIIKLFLDVGRGLAAAHRAGLVHRDLKPENVMVGDDGRVRVMDFGLARVGARGEPLVELGSAADPSEDIDADASASTPRELALDLDLTRTGALLGTPMYMAPEQWEGAETDARTDQFAYCVALWEALYGERPFRGATVPALAKAVTEGAITQPRDPTLAPPWIRPVLERGLEVDPARRWPSMDALLAELSGERSPTPRRGIPSAALVGFVGLAAIVGLVALVISLDLRPPPPPAEPGWALHEVVDAFADAVVDAAADGRWIVGTAELPDVVDPRGSAYLRLRALERIHGAAAQTRARALRGRLFAALSRLAARAWAAEEGSYFAADLYAQACLFAYDDAGALAIDDAAAAARALDRAGLDREGLAALHEEALRGALTLRRPVSEPEPEPEPGPEAEPEPEEPPLPCPVGMAEIAGGSLHGKTIRPFCLDVTEVTVSAFKRCVERGRCVAGDTYEVNVHCNLDAPGRARHPINCVDLSHAQALCASQGKRLPSELEWEWAARSRDPRRSRPWGDAPPSCANTVMRRGRDGVDGCGRDSTAAVGSRPRGDSVDGLKDMIGNVWEWTDSVEAGQRILRGGGWMDSLRDQLRADARILVLPTLASLQFGIRCARDRRAQPGD